MYKIAVTYYQWYKPWLIGFKSYSWVSLCVSFHKLKSSHRIQTLSPTNRILINIKYLVLFKCSKEGFRNKLIDQAWQIRLCLSVCPKCNCGGNSTKNVIHPYEPFNFRQDDHPVQSFVLNISSRNYLNGLILLTIPVLLLIASDELFLCVFFRKCFVECNILVLGNLSEHLSSHIVCSCPSFPATGDAS